MSYEQFKADLILAYFNKYSEFPNKAELDHIKTLADFVFGA